MKKATFYLYSGKGEFHYLSATSIVTSIPNTDALTIILIIAARVVVRVLTTF